MVNAFNSQYNRRSNQPPDFKRRRMDNNSFESRNRNESRSRYDRNLTGAETMYRPPDETFGLVEDCKTCINKGLRNGGHATSQHSFISRNYRRLLDVTLTPNQYEQQKAQALTKYHSDQNWNHDPRQLIAHVTNYLRNNPFTPLNNYFEQIYGGRGRGRGRDRGRGRGRGGFGYRGRGGGRGGRGRGNQKFDTPPYIDFKRFNQQIKNTINSCLLSNNQSKTDDSTKHVTFVNDPGNPKSAHLTGGLTDRR